MEFAETYRQEVLRSRQDRARRALFWSRVLGLVLMLTVAAVLRAEPDLRRALATAGTDAILAVAGRQASAGPGTATGIPKDAGDTGIRVATRPRDRVRVNRPGGFAPADDMSAGPAVDPAALANETGARLRKMKPRP